MERYPNGYIPKINYWSGRVLEATTPSDREKAMASLRYFMARQKQYYKMLDIIKSISDGLMELESSKMT